MWETGGKLGKWWNMSNIWEKGGKKECIIIQLQIWKKHVGNYFEGVVKIHEFRMIEQQLQDLCNDWWRNLQQDVGCCHYFVCLLSESCRNIMDHCHAKNAQNRWEHVNNIIRRHAWCLPSLVVHDRTFLLLICAEKRNITNLRYFAQGECLVGYLECSTQKLGIVSSTLW